MNVSLYSITVPLFINSLESLTRIIDKAEAFAREKKIDDAVLLDARFAPDMFPLVMQIQITADYAKGTPARLAGVEVPKFPDTEKTFAELRARVAKTIDYLKTFTPDQFNEGEERAIELPYQKGMILLGRDYAREYALPNFFFHYTTAYDILRHNGVQIGKADFIGKLTLKS